MSIDPMLLEEGIDDTWPLEDLRLKIEMSDLQLGELAAIPMRSIQIGATSSMGTELDTIRRRAGARLLEVLEALPLGMGLRLDYCLLPLDGELWSICHLYSLVLE